MKKLLLLAAITASACTGEPSAAVKVQHKMSEGDTASPAPLHPLTPTDEALATSTTTTAVPTPSTTTEPASVTTVVRRRTTSTVYEPPARPTQLAPVVHGADFWYRLAMCESGAGAGSPNIFQFMGGTAEKVGYYPGASYEEQRAMAIDWASRIHPGEGTSAGWPECWHVAKAGGS